MYDEFQGGDGPRMQIKKSASYNSSSLPSLCANTFCEELADALLQRASSLRNFHPSVIVGREERFIESLIDLARAIRPALPEPEEEMDPEKNAPEESFKLEHYVEISPPPEISAHITPVRIPKCRRFRGVAWKKEWKKGKRKTLWSRMRRRLIKECPGLKPGSRKLEWRYVKKTLGKGWKTKKTTLMRFVDRLFGNLN